MNFKDKKGSISIFVLVALLFMSAFLIISFGANVNKSKVAKEQAEIINSIYQMKLVNTNEIYDKRTAVPVINQIPDVIFVRFDSITSYFDSGDGKEMAKTELILDDKTFDSEENMNKYIEQNNAYGEKELTIKLTNSIGNTTTKTQTITFEKTVAPIIKTIPTPIITNITNIEESYVTYDGMGKKEETYTITVNNEVFSNMTNLTNYADKWLLDNKQYEIEVNIKIIAKGKNNLTTESTQTIKFIRGVVVANETELNTALASTSPSYIQVANDITCNNTISVDGVTHKLDLNNSTISKTVVNESFTFITLGSNTNLTVLDNSSPKQGKIIAKLSEPNNDTGSKNDRLNTIYTLNNQGTLNIQSGTISSDLLQKLGKPGKNIHVKDLAKTIKNTGTLYLNGGNIKSNAVTQAANHGFTRNGEATAIGIENTGTVHLNSGNITCYAESSIVMTLGTLGETRAYAYGVTNSGGTVNRNENVTISVTAIANEEDSYKETVDKAEIKDI